MGDYCRPQSRSVAAAKVNQIAALLIRVQHEEGNSQEEDASLLREISRLALAAAQDLDPREKER